MSVCRFYYLKIPRREFIPEKAVNRHKRLRDTELAHEVIDLCDSVAEIIAGYEFADNKPFNNVYFTGIVRDKIGRKMSKSLGNSPDPLDLIDKFGADGVRMGLMLGAPAGNDIMYDDSLCEQGRNFCTKIIRL